MMDRQTEELAALYVLDLLEGQEREDFERRLAGSPELRRQVRDFTRGLHDPAAVDPGPARWDLLAGIHQKLGADTPMPEPARAGSGRRRASLPWAFIWASAAAILLLMNLALLFLLESGSPAGKGDRFAGIAEGAVEDAGVESADPDPIRQFLEARIRRLEGELSESRSLLAASEETREVLERENREVREYNAGWQREYHRLAARFLPFFEPNDGMGRFTVIEMVDARAFATDAPRRGFADLAGEFLLGQGNIAGTAPEDFVGPVAAGAGTASAASAGELGLTPLARSESTARSDESGTEPVPPGSTEAPLAGEYGEAVGFTVWRDDEQKGFLDIYNLPDPPDGSAPYLWVRSSEFEDYLPVGYLPELENGSGSVFYSVEEPNFTPAEIVITAEDAVQPGSEPSGEILLRGP